MPCIRFDDFLAGERKDLNMAKLIDEATAEDERAYERMRRMESAHTPDRSDHSSGL